VGRESKKEGKKPERIQRENNLNLREKTLNAQQKESEGQGRNNRRGKLTKNTKKKGWG